jgi:hypothetical protein
MPNLTGNQTFPVFLPYEEIDNYEYRANSTILQKSASKSLNAISDNRLLNTAKDKGCTLHGVIIVSNGMKLTRYVVK